MLNTQVFFLNINKDISYFVKLCAFATAGNCDPKQEGYILLFQSLGLYKYTIFLSQLINKKIRFFYRGSMLTIFNNRLKHKKHGS